MKPSESIATLSRLLRDKRIGAAIVSNDGNTIDGVISERDVAYGLAVHESNLHTLLVSALMTKAVITCSPRDDVAKVASTMLSRNIRHIPVHDGNGLIGMVSIRDVLKERLEELQRETAQLRSLAIQTNPEPQDR
ncbi:MAG: CBS domain-containing protein [Hyphomicrobiaceae bacterium]|nr:CBS domain-containing protein [Hyphomicrobiaceae bacterium]